ncbi:MAG: hydrogenase maturation nickel metallochaperone HypA [Candidatus Aminicenantes bacterium]|nr:hydrogenase maturation nickel metallochaperone HypA [Candidatus Aminicenantes bacterium]
MHELSIVASLFEILEEKAQEQGARKIVLVKLRVGKLAGVVPEFLRTAFDIYKDGTIAREAVLEIEEVPFRVRCRACRTVAERDDFVFICPACGSNDLETLEGTELLLEKLEMEV